MLHVPEDQPALRNIATRAPRVHQRNAEDDDFRRRDWIAAQWQICPWLVIFVGGGDCVILDGARRPIIRVFADERTEILAPDAVIKSETGKSYLIHYDFGLPPGPQARKVVTGFIETYKLAPELRRRRELLRRGLLPQWNGAPSHWSGKRAAA